MNGHDLLKKLQGMSEADLNLPIGAIYYSNEDDDSDKPLFMISNISVAESEDANENTIYILIIE